MENSGSSSEGEGKADDTKNWTAHREEEEEEGKDKKKRKKGKYNNITNDKSKLLHRSKSGTIIRLLSDVERDEDILYERDLEMAISRSVLDQGNNNNNNVVCNSGDGYSSTEGGNFFDSIQGANEYYHYKSRVRNQRWCKVKRQVEKVREKMGAEKWSARMEGVEEHLKDPLLAPLLYTPYMEASLLEFSFRQLIKPFHTPFSESCGFLSVLPEEVLLLIFDFIGVYDLVLNFRRLNIELSSLTHDEHLWRRWIDRDKVAPVTEEFYRPLGKSMDWVYRSVVKNMAKSSLAAANDVGFIVHSDHFLYTGEWTFGMKSGDGRIIRLSELDTLSFISFNNKKTESIKTDTSSTSPHIVIPKTNRQIGRTSGIKIKHVQRYEGKWVNDLFEGHGVLCTTKGRYEGSFHIGKRDGTGKMSSINGTSFEGLFRNGVRIHGTFKWKDGTTYAGQWKDNKRSGQGILSWPTGKIYDGYWENNMMHGYGVLTLANGDSYVGNFKNGRKQGVGEYTLANSGGVCVTGTWGEKGLGFISFPNGKTEGLIDFLRRKVSKKNNNIIINSEERDEKKDKSGCKYGNDRKRNESGEIRGRNILEKNGGSLPSLLPNKKRSNGISKKRRILNSSGYNNEKKRNE